MRIVHLVVSSAIFVGCNLGMNRTVDDFTKFEDFKTPPDRSIISNGAVLLRWTYADGKVNVGIIHKNNSNKIHQINVGFQLSDKEPGYVGLMMLGEIAKIASDEELDTKEVIMWAMENKDKINASRRFGNINVSVQDPVVIRGTAWTVFNVF